MEKVWYSEYGFESNPLSIKPGEYTKTVSNYEGKLREITKLVKAGKFVFITSEYGRGKTSVLKKIARAFAGQRKVAYVSGNSINKGLEMDSILSGAGGLFSRVLGIRSRDVILLLDETQDINQNDADSIVRAYDEGYIKSVVIASASKPHPAINRMFNGLIGKNRFTLEGITGDDAVKLVRARIGKLEIISDEMIRMIYSHDNNPRALLRNCEDVIRHAFNKGDKKVAKEHVEAVLRF